MRNLLRWLGSLFNRKPVPPMPVPTPQPVPPTVDPPSPIDPTDDPAAIVATLINAERSRRGLARLRDDAKLQGIATQWAAAMGRSGVLSHGNFSGRISSAYPNVAGAENIVEGQPTAAAVVAAWMGSPGHRANILGDYDAIGVGKATGRDGSIWWVADFAGLGG